MSVERRDRDKKYGVEPILSSRGTGMPGHNKWAHANIIDVSRTLIVSSPLKLASCLDETQSAYASDVIALEDSQNTISIPKIRTVRPFLEIIIKYKTIPIR